MASIDCTKNIRVVVRLRPFNQRELELNPRTIIRVADSSSLIFDPDDDEEEFFFHGAKQTYRDVTKRIRKKLLMKFDDVFDSHSNNQKIFETSMRPLVGSVMAGFNCSVFVYGATGAGKTHTMLGSESNPGITYLTMRELFEQIDNLKSERKFDIGISYLEVYNEQVMNLLTKSGPLKLREDTAGVIVSGLSLKPIYNANELLELLALGNRNRTQHPTDANAESSRSHAIFQVHIRMMNKETNVKKTVKLSMIDLAGSERAASTKCMGLRFKEGASINKSLLALGNVINKLADGLKHIPYRDSNLTRILKDSLGGNCQTVMIANVSPSSHTYEDTYNTLKYASRAKKIRIALRQNIVKTNMPKDFYIQKVQDLLAENEMLKQKLQAITNDQSNEKLNGCGTNLSGDADMKSWYAKLDKVYASVKHSIEIYFDMVSKAKLLKFRTKMKESAEALQKILTLDGTKLNEKIGKIQASINKFNSQLVNQQEDMGRWKCRLRDENTNLKSVQKDVSDQGFNDILAPYIQGKEYELEASMATIKATHLSKIMSIYHIECENLRKSLHLSNEIIQENYILLRATGSMDSSLENKLLKLQTLNEGHRGVRFLDNECQMINEYTLNVNIPNIDEIESPKRMKRCQSDDQLNEDNSTAVRGPSRKLFKEDTTSKSSGLTNSTKLNETIIIDTQITTDEFLHPNNMIEGSQRIKSKKPHSTLIKAILSEHKTNSTSALINKVVRPTIKSTISSRPTLNVKKENDKYFTLSRTKKSPKPNSPRSASNPKRAVLGRRRSKTAFTTRPKSIADSLKPAIAKQSLKIFK